MQKNGAQICDLSFCFAERMRFLPLIVIGSWLRLKGMR